MVARRVFLKLPQGYGKTPGANTLELNDGPRDFGVRCPAGWCLPRSRLASNPVAEIISVDAIPPTAAPSNAGTNRPPNPPFIRSGHLTAPGFSDHRIYWEEYGTLAGEPVMVMHGGPGAGSHTSSTRFFDPQRYRVILFDQRGCGKSTPSASAQLFGTDRPRPGMPVEAQPRHSDPAQLDVDVWATGVAARHGSSGGMIARHGPLISTM